MIAFGLLSLFVLVFAPHQFAVLSLFLIQGMTTVRAGFTAVRVHVHPRQDRSLLTAASVFRSISARKRSQSRCPAHAALASTAKRRHPDSMAKEPAGRLVVAIPVGSQSAGHHRSTDASGAPQKRKAPRNTTQQVCEASYLNIA